jgi:chemotaxis protein MotA
MLGTVIGLINMLGNLTDPDQLGIGMSLALLTTLYGVLFANLFFLPVANRLENLNKAELAARDMALDGILAMQAGVSSRMLVERLETYLPPSERLGYQARNNAGTAEAAVRRRPDARQGQGAYSPRRGGGQGRTTPTAGSGPTATPSRC